MMKTISSQAKCSEIYTNHCLRATAITVLNNNNFDSRTIATLSGHRCEASIRSYCRDSSSDQKRQMSSTLDSFFPNMTDGKIPPRQNAVQPEAEARTASVPSVHTKQEPSVMKLSHMRDCLFSNCQFSGNISMNFSKWTTSLSNLLFSFLKLLVSKTFRFF